MNFDALKEKFVIRYMERTKKNKCLSNKMIGQFELKNGKKQFPFNSFN